MSIFWSEDERETCKEMWAKGYLGKEIAEVLDKEIGSISGVVKRYGFTRGNEFLKPVERCEGLRG